MQNGTLNASRTKDEHVAYADYADFDDAYRPSPTGRLYNTQRIHRPATQPLLNSRLLLSLSQFD
jgi:hypothetical protein